MIKKGDHYLIRSTRKNVLERSTSGGLVPELLGYLIASQRASAALCHTAEGDMIKPYFLTDQSKVCEVCGSKFIAFQNLPQIMRDSIITGQIAVVVKPCESRAVMWLKKNGIIKGDPWLIGLNCGGVLDPKEAMTILSRHGKKMGHIHHIEFQDEYLIYHFDDNSVLRVPFAESGLRDSCKRCIVPIPSNVDIGVGYWGAQGKYTYTVVISDRAEEALNEMLRLGVIEVIQADESARKLREQMIRMRIMCGEKYREMKLSLIDQVDVGEILNRCILCYECWTNCPVRTGHVPSHGTTSPVLWQIGVINYMIDKCIECGACEDSCPVNIPFELFIQKTRQIKANIEKKR
ncbi:MAG: Coenzyme F420 hydrogenase/dehydrogenase, beta subunit C-terminal domain [Candidatus Korarchaeota archaeon]